MVRAIRTKKCWIPIWKILQQGWRQLWNIWSCQTQPTKYGMTTVTGGRKIERIAYRWQSDFNIIRVIRLMPLRRRWSHLSLWKRLEKRCCSSRTISCKSLSKKVALNWKMLALKWARSMKRATMQGSLTRNSVSSCHRNSRQAKITRSSVQNERKKHSLEQ